ncbi:MAG: hypothetical protein D6776_07700 [Planctomycetota bacterium]|nr:MAG: hypothetical protein D6776_07700 [Planctomycetota bacterium]
MQIEQLLQIVLDPQLGRGWPAEAGPVPRWPVGARWRVEYTFTPPALPASALALGSELRAIWRYEVVEAQEREDGTPTVTLRISPERGAPPHYFVLATYDRRDLRLLEARRFEGERELPLFSLELPPLDETVELEPGADEDAPPAAVTRRFSLPEPPPGPEPEPLEPSVDLGELLEQEQEV